MTSSRCFLTPKTSQTPSLNSPQVTFIILYLFPLERNLLRTETVPIGFKAIFLALNLVPSM
jgi:hypothetical protein